MVREPLFGERLSKAQVQDPFAQIAEMPGKSRE